MATTLQIAANRQNATASTGPRTDEGKTKSSHNSLRHGLTARGLIVLPDQEDNFAELESGLRSSLLPLGALQEVIFMRILESTWTLHRCRLAEAQIYLTSSGPAIDPLLDDQNEAKYARIAKYARQSESSMYRAMRELGNLQTEAQYRREVQPPTEDAGNAEEKFEQPPPNISVVCSVQKIMASVGRIAKQSASTRDFMTMLEQFTAPTAAANVTSIIPVAA
jgi:hypothetical protein